jgi:hypothetical protein
MKQEVKLDEIKKTVKAFNPQVMSVVRGGIEVMGCNCVLTCKKPDEPDGVFVIRCQC